MSFLLLLVGPLLGAGVVRLMGWRRPVAVILGALVGQLLTTAAYGRAVAFGAARAAALPARGRAVGFIQFQTTMQHRIGAGMILAGIAVGVAVLVLLVPGDQPASPDASPRAG